jgi:hypothetical protein
MSKPTYSRAQVAQNDGSSGSKPAWVIISALARAQLRCARH